MDKNIVPTIKKQRLCQLGMCVKFSLPCGILADEGGEKVKK